MVKTQHKLQELQRNIASVYMGNAGAIDRLIVSLLARGHILIEDVPGVGKTVLASAMAKSIDCSFARIQCTPDLLPSDITGISMFDRTSSEFSFRAGPIFNNIIVNTHNRPLLVYAPRTELLGVMWVLYRLNLGSPLEFSIKEGRSLGLTKEQEIKLRN